MSSKTKFIKANALHTLPEYFPRLSKLSGEREFKKSSIFFSMMS
jgi:hypothetical protein